MEPSNTLCLVNIPLDMTRIQLKERFFKDLECNLKNIKFPDSLHKEETKTKTGFVRFETINEARMAKTIIINAEYKGITAKFAKGDKKHPERVLNGNTSSPPNEAIDFQKCAFCGDDEVELVCSGCCNQISGTFYCCSDHQARDWLRHKSECKEMPILRKFQELTLKEAPTNLIQNETACRSKFFIKSIEKQPKVGDKVYITKVASPRVVFVRPVSDNDGYEKLLEAVKKAANNSSNKRDKPEISDHVLAPFRASFHRAKVLDIFESDENNCNIKVFIVDFGDEIKVKWQNCKELLFSPRGMRSFLFKFVLDGVQVAHEHRDIMTYLNDIKENNEALLISSESGDRKVLKRINEEIINDEINRIAVRNSLISTAVSSEPVLYNTLIIPKIEPGNAVKISIVNNSKFESDRMLACMSQENYPEYLKLMSAIREYSKSLSADNYIPKVPLEICLVRFRGTWHRAAVLNLDDLPEQVAVTFIDILTDAIISVDEIHPIPKGFTKHFFTLLYRVDCNENDLLNASFKEITEPGSAIVQIKCEDNCQIIKFS